MIYATNQQISAVEVVGEILTTADESLVNSNHPHMSVPSLDTVTVDPA